MEPLSYGRRHEDFAGDKWGSPVFSALQNSKALNPRQYET